MSKTRPPVPRRVTQALEKLGADLKNARRRRRIPMAYAANLALISRSTLHKIERGDQGVSLGSYATVLLGYGMIERLEGLVDVRWDRAGLAQEENRMPRRIRRVTTTPEAVAADCRKTDPGCRKRALSKRLLEPQLSDIPHHPRVSP